MNGIFFAKFKLLGTVISGVFICLFFVVTMPEITGAESVVPDWSWSVAKPEVFSSTIVAGVSSDMCPGSYKLKDIVGQPSAKKVCISEGDLLNFGFYFSFPSFYYVVSFPYDNKMYPLNTLCGQYDNCLYLPDSDALVTKQYLTNGSIARSLLIYKNFSKRLVRSVDALGATTGYSFNLSNPDYTFGSESGGDWPIIGAGASSNGKWLAVELRDRGIGLLNIETMKMKRISTMAYRYGTGRDVYTEMAVSNDGRQIAIMGINAGMTIFSVDSECGDNGAEGAVWPVMPLVNPCKEATIVQADLIPGFYIASHPRFNDDGGELNFYVTSYIGEERAISLRAAGYGGQKLDYLALGDSFSSGEGESSDSFYLKGTNEKYEKCHVSTRSYPFLLANLSNINPKNMKNVACSGATMGDVVGDDDFKYWGQDERLGLDGLGYNPVDKILSQVEAKMSFLPGRIHQERFVEEYHPEIITIGVGGNDAGFMQKLQACLGLDTCNWATDPIKKEQTAVEIKNLFKVFVNTYNELLYASPSSSMYAVGYPKLVSDSSDNGGCDLITGLMLDNAERQFMNEAVIYLNQIIEAAAKKVGIKYLDIQDSYDDHVLCGSSQPIAVNSIKLGDDISPISQLNWLKFIGQESFHPNPVGHSYAAESIFASVGNILSYNYCANNSVVCPIGVTAPEPSGYWIPENYHNYPILKLANFVFDRVASVDNKQKQIILPSQSLALNSSVIVEINSIPRLLGQFQVTTDGSLDIGVDLPVDLSEGYHTIHVYGTSYSGESVDLYQVIKYMNPAVVPIDQLQQTETGGIIVDDDTKTIDINTNIDSVIEGISLSQNGLIEDSKITKENVKVVSNSNIISETWTGQSEVSTSVNPTSVLGASLENESATQNLAQTDLNKKPVRTFDGSLVFLTFVAILIISLVIFAVKYIRKHKV